MPETTSYHGHKPPDQWDEAYWKDHVAARHMWRLMGLRGLRADVYFGEPIHPEGHTRKTLAAAAHGAVVALRAKP